MTYDAGWPSQKEIMDAWMGRLHKKVARFDNDDVDSWLPVWRKDLASRLGVSTDPPEGLQFQDCWACRKEGKGARLERHHLVPRSRNGSNDPLNFVLLCASCHKRIDDSSILRSIRWMIGRKAQCAKEADADFRGAKAMLGLDTADVEVMGKWLEMQTETILKTHNFGRASDNSFSLKASQECDKAMTALYERILSQTAYSIHHTFDGGHTQAEMVRFFMEGIAKSSSVL